MSLSGVTFSLLILCSFQHQPTFKGTWQFVGGVYNGIKEEAPKEYSLQRRYNAASYEAFAIENGYQPEKYETGNYILKGDTCIDVQTFCSQPSKITNIAIRYLFTLNRDTLTIKGSLPTGMIVEEYWKKIK